MNSLSILWRGMLMGLAEVVPGVSGGTMALVTGIYQQLIEALASFGIASFGLLRDFPQFVKHHRLAFLIPLGIGMVAGVVVFAQVMGYLLAHFKPVVWAFFFGVIAASVYVVGRLRSWVNLLIYGSVGLVMAIGVLFSNQLQGDPSPLTFFLAGMLAVSAWILPAISGSYMLLLLGLYEPVLAAVRAFDLVMLFSLLAGCAVGLMLFVRVLKWLLQRWYEPLLALLTGFMLGSVVNLWPWQVAAATRLEQFVSPTAYTMAEGDAAMMLPVIIAFGLGSIFLWSISRQRL